MAISLATVVSSEEYVEACDFDMIHARAEYMTGRVWREADAIVRVCGIKADGLDHGKSRKDVLLGVKLADIAVCSGR